MKMTDPSLWTAPDSPHARMRGGRTRGDMLRDLARDRAPRIELEGLARIYEGSIPWPLHHLVQQIAPRAPGARYVYVLSGRAGVLYVGQSLNPAQRLLDHRKNPRLRQTTFLSLFRPESPGVFYDSPDAEIAELERCAIADLVPAVNRERITPTRDIGAPWEAIQRDAERRIGNENRRGL